MRKLKQYTRKYLLNTKAGSNRETKKQDDISFIQYK